MDGRLRILETIYRFDVSERDHIQLIQEAAANHWQKHSPVILLNGVLRSNGGAAFTKPDATRSDGKNYVELLRSVMQKVPMNEMNHNLRITPMYGSAKELLANGVLINKTPTRILESFGIADIVGYWAGTGEGGAVALMAILSTIPRMSERERNHWQPLAEHLTAGWRIRQRLEHGAALLDLADAIFRPSGHYVDFMDSRISGGTRERLQAFVRNRELERSARTTLDHLWPDLIDGRWTLIDHYEADGRRVVLALRNTPMAASLSRLSRNEVAALSFIRHGASNKEISLSMSISSATVTRLLRSAAIKLNAALANIIQFSRTDTIRAHDLFFGTTGLTVLSQDTTEQWATLLTDAEREVVAEVLRGRTNREIAAARGRSVRTVVNQLASAFEKMNVRSRRELMSRATGYTAEVDPSKDERC